MKGCGGGGRVSGFGKGQKGGGGMVWRCEGV